MSPVELLAGQPFFSGLAPAQLERIADCARLAEHRAGTLLLRQGDEARAIHLLLEGSVALEVTVPGRRPLVLETLGEGELVGASWLLPPARAHFDVRARTFLRTLRIDTACLLAAMETDSALGYAFCRRFMEVVLRRLQATRLQLTDLYAHPRLFPSAGCKPSEKGE